MEFRVITRVVMCEMVLVSGQTRWKKGRSLLPFRNMSVWVRSEPIVGLHDETGELTSRSKFDR